MAESPKIYFRVHLEKTSPAGHPVRIGVSVFESFRFFPWITFGKFGIGKKSGKIPFSTEFAAVLPWDSIGKEDWFAPGETTPWVEISADLAGAKGDSPARPPSTKTFCVAFQSPLLPSMPGAAPSPRPIRRGFKGDGGNLKGVGAILEFADAPDEKALVKSLRVTTDLSVIPVVLSGLLDRKLKLKSLREFEQIRHVNEVLQEEYDFLKRNLPGETAPLKRCVSSSWIHHGYHFNLYDSAAERIRMESLKLMGFNYINWYITPPRTPAPDGISFQFIEFPTGPEWLLKSPFAPIDEEEAVSRIRGILETWRKDYRIDSSREVYCRVGDEIKLLSEDLLYPDPACAPAFRRFLKDRGIAVDGTETPVRGSSIHTEQDARLYYYSTEFRHQLTLDFWKTYMRIFRRAFGRTPVRFGMESCGISRDAWPDYHEMSMVPIMDFFIHEYTTKMWIPHHYGIAKAARLASAAKYGREEAGGLFAPGRVASGIGSDLLGISALGRGFRHAFFYCFFPDDPQGRKNVQLATARFNRRFSQLEHLILNGESTANSGIVAVGISAASDLWRGAKWQTRGIPYLARGVLCERNLLMAALGMNQVPFDYFPEELMKQHLENYRILFLPDPNLLESLHGIVVDWVRRGGHLVTIAGSAAQNEFNLPASLGEKLVPGYLARRTGGRDKFYGEFAPELYNFKPVGNVSLKGRKTDFVLIREELEPKDGTVLLEWENRRPAAVEYPVGKGKWTHLGFLPGASMARSAQDAFRKSLRNLRRPELQHDQCAFAPELLTLYGSLIPSALRERKVWIDRPGVEAALWEDNASGALLLADYTDKKPKQICVRLKSGGKWAVCRREDGTELEIRNENGIQTIRLPFLSTEVLTLRKKGEK